MVSNTKIKERIRRKTNPALVDTINAARENEAWKEVVRALSGATRKQTKMNLFEIDAQTKLGDTVVIPGKVLAKGNLTKKVVICAFSASEKVKEKIKDSKSEFVQLIDEIKKNKKAEGVKILK